MRVAIIGNGGREHALVWHCARQREIEQVFAIPGNPGAAGEPGVVCIAADISAQTQLIQTLRNRDVDLVLIGPEVPLAAGLADACHDAGLCCLGPTRAAARLESSKVFMKEFCHRHAIPTATCRVFTKAAPALEYLRRVPLPVVVKADGLAAGKGVVVATARDMALEAARTMLSGQRHGAAGHRIVIEDFLPGVEASFTVLTDGERLVSLAAAQDHKARDDGDQGPNTGGMGACSPAPVLTDPIRERVVAEIMRPAIRGMATEGHRYQGFLYAGLMISPAGEPCLLEFNCRLGDPETQVILPRLESNLATRCYQATQGTLDATPLRWSAQAALGVVLAAPGYPEEPITEAVIQGLASPPAEGVQVFHAGTRVAESDIVTAGGRVLCITALGDSLRAAHENAYAAVAGIHWPGMVWRRDIGHRSI